MTSTQALCDRITPEWQALKAAGRPVAARAAFDDVFARLAELNDLLSNGEDVR
jgi:hypothetical protein